LISIRHNKGTASVETSGSSSIDAKWCSVASERIFEIRKIKLLLQEERRRGWQGGESMEGKPDKIQDYSVDFGVVSA
jgi:hypothetical protein